MEMEISETGRQGQKVKQGETGTNGGVSVGDPSKIRPYSSLTGLLSLFSLTAFSFRKPKNKRKAE